MGQIAVNLGTDTYSPIDGGHGYDVHCTIALSSSYSTGGDTWSATQFGLEKINKLFMNAASGYVFEWLPTTNQAIVPTTGLIKAYWQSNPASPAVLVEVTAGTNLSGISIRAHAQGV